MVYPAFLKQCGAALKETVNDDDKIKDSLKKRYLAQYDQFGSSCKRQHAPEVVEFANALVERGCTLDLPKVKQHNAHDSRLAPIKPSKIETGATTPWASAKAAIDGDCTTLHSMLARLHEAKEQCCMSDGDCPDGFPEVCHPGCAIAFHGMFKKCGVIMSTFLPAKILSTYAHFDGLCTSENSVDLEGFLKAISHATCCGTGHSSCAKSCKDKHQQSPKCGSGMYTICGTNGQKDYDVCESKSTPLLCFAPLIMVLSHS